MGTVRLSVNNENARTILPKENAFKSFLVVFIASDTNSGKTTCFYKVGFDEVNADYTIALGYYKQVKVHVFSSGNWHADSLCAIGEHNDEFEIKSTGVNDTIKILIDPFDAGSIPNKEGYFSWKIVDNPVNDLVSSPGGKAQMTITSLSGTSSYFKEIKFLDSDSEFDFIDNISLKTGIYNVSFEFGKADFSYVKFSEILYIAPGGAVSYYEYEIPKLASTKVSITYKSNFPGAVDMPLDTTVGSLIPIKPISSPNPDRTQIFKGWYKDAALTKQWNFSYDRVLSDTILYAKWEKELNSISLGTFTMGSPEGEPGRVDVEETQHSVTLDPFYISKYQVTQEQYKTVMGTNPSYGSSEPAAGENQGKRPVETVSWYDALVFCNTLSILEGLSPVYTISGSTDPAVWGAVPTDRDMTWDSVIMDRSKNGYRLPTEAEWEYACRAGTLTAYNTGSSLDGGYAWSGANAGGKTHEVGKKLPNAWELYDMHGNVWELCWDWFQYYGSAAQTNPTGPAAGTWRMYRGGGWGNAFYEYRSAKRYGVYPWVGLKDIGFRVVRSS